MARAERGHGVRKVRPPSAWWPWGLSLCALVGTVALVVYANAVGHGFVSDDEYQVLLNPWITSPRFLPAMFSKSVWSFMAEASVRDYYRPLMHVIYLVCFELFGLQSWGFHLVNVLLHAVNSVLVFLLAARLLGGHGGGAASGNGVAGWLLTGPVAAGLLFATHTIHTEAVAWVAAVPELAVCGLYVAALLAYAGRTRGNGGVWPVALFGLALFCKETALTFLAALVAYDLAFSSAEGLELRFRRYAPYMVVTLAFLVVRTYVLSQAHVVGARADEIGVLQWAVNGVVVFAQYARLLVLPTSLRFWYPSNAVYAAASGEAAVSFAVGVGVLTAAWFCWRREPVAWFGLILFGITLAPALYVNAIVGTPLAERYLYLPSVGGCILAGWLLQRTSGAPLGRWVGVAILSAVVSAHAVGTYVRNQVWKDAYELFTDAERKGANPPAPPYELAVSLLNLGRSDEALAHFRILVHVNPKDARALSAMGGALLRQGRVDEAIESLEAALGLDPALADAYNDLAVAFRRQGKEEEAIAQYRAALRQDPSLADAHFNLANALAGRGSGQEALEHYREAVRLQPDRHYYRNVLGIELGKQGRLDDASEQFREAVRLAPTEPAYARNLERALAMRGE